MAKPLTATVKVVTTRQGTAGFLVKDTHGDRYGLYRTRLAAETRRMRVQWSLDRFVAGLPWRLFS